MRLGDDSPSLRRGATLFAGFGGIGGVAMTLATNAAATAGDWHGDFAGVDHSLFVTSPRIVLPGKCGDRDDADSCRHAEVAVMDAAEKKHAFIGEWILLRDGLGLDANPCSKSGGQA